jgi:hypothetical protein
MGVITLALYDVKEVRDDYIVLIDNTSEVKVTFAGGSGSMIDTDPPITKEENARFFKGIKCQVGLEVPIVPLSEPRTMNLFLDHFVDLFGWLRSVPFPFPVSRIEVRSTVRP